LHLRINYRDFHSEKVRILGLKTDFQDHRGGEAMCYYFGKIAIATFKQIWAGVAMGTWGVGGWAFVHMQVRGSWRGQTADDRQVIGRGQGAGHAAPEAFSEAIGMGKW
jgi:hypothetical protein